MGRIVALPGSPHGMADALRALADRCEAGEVQAFIVVTLESDRTTGFLDYGASSLVQRLGMLALAQETVIAQSKARDEWDI